MTEFAVRRHDEEDRVLVSVEGEVDIATAPELLATVTAAVAHSPAVFLDLGAVTFLDAAGLAALVAGHSAAVDRGGSLVLHDVPPLVRRLLRVTALDAVLVVAENAADPT